MRRAVPLLLDHFTPAPRPVIIHGDLWSGNVGYDRTTSQPVIFDPSSYWGHNEAELGMTRMFGGERRFSSTLFNRLTCAGFTNDFYDAYHEIQPPSQPYHEQRIDLYELYHHLNVSFFDPSLDPADRPSTHSCLAVHTSPVPCESCDH